MPAMVAAALATRPPEDTRPVLLMAQDEGRFGRINPPRACWAPPGVRPTVVQQVVRESVYVYAAVAPALGQMASLILPGADTAAMNVFLRHGATTFADYFILLQLDGAGWHTSSALEVPENMRLIWQAPYSPELNPVEHLWTYLRTHHLRNSWFDSLDAVIERLINGIQTIAGRPEQLTTMTYFPHLRIVSLDAN